MRHRPTLTGHTAVARGLNSCLTLLLCLGIVPLSACDAHGTASDEPLTYRVTEGACGDVVFVERIGSDATSAFETIEAQKVDQWGRDNVRIEAYALDVVDADGNVPTRSFYALRVLNADTGTHLHSVSEVITSDGDLFRLMWCPD